MPGAEHLVARAACLLCHPRQGTGHPPARRYEKMPTWLRSAARTAPCPGMTRHRAPVIRATRRSTILWALIHTALLLLIGAAIYGMGAVLS